MTQAHKKLFCFGHGYSCDYIAHELMQDGQWRVVGTTRDAEKRKALRARGIDAFLFDADVPLADPLYIMRDATHLLISTPPSDEGDPAFDMHANDIVKLQNLEWVGYLSTTGVYGDRSGDWVDENSEIRPSSIRGSRRARAEDQWLSLLKSHNVPVHIFRLAGIYGPGRSALDSVRAGVARRIEKQGHAFSRIHVEDIAQCIISSMTQPTPGEAYNLADDYPAPSHEVIAYACELLNMPTPPLLPYEKADLAPITRSFYADNKRIHNDKIKQILGVELRYPDYKSGLQACLRAEKQAVALFKGMV